MLYKGADLIRDVEFVIFDEVHYVNDAEVSRWLFSRPLVPTTLKGPCDYRSAAADANLSEVWCGKKSSSCCLSMSISSSSPRLYRTPRSLPTGSGEHPPGSSAFARFIVLTVLPDARRRRTSTSFLRRCDLCHSSTSSGRARSCTGSSTRRASGATRGEWGVALRFGMLGGGIV